MKNIEFQFYSKNYKHTIVNSFYTYAKMMT